MKYCVECNATISSLDLMVFSAKNFYFCNNCFTHMSNTTSWSNALIRLPQGDERQVLVKRDNSRGGFWIDIAWWRPSANIFDDGLAVDFWCEIPE